MWRFVLPAIAMVSALLVLFAGALGDLRSWPALSHGATSIMAAVVPTRPTPPAATRPTTDTPPQQTAQPQASRDVLQGQIADLQQQANALKGQIDQRKQELGRSTQELDQRKQQLSQSAQDLNQRTQEINERTQQLAQRNRELDTLRADADKLRKIIDTLHQQRAEQEAALARQKPQDQQVAAASRARPPNRQSGAPTQPVTPPPAMQPVLTPSASQQLLTARQWLAGGRPEEARRVLAMVQTQMVFQPVTPDQPAAQGGNTSATEVGNAIRWLDRGANGQAMDAINRAIDGMAVANSPPAPWTGYPADVPRGYVQATPPGYYTEYNGR